MLINSMTKIGKNIIIKIFLSTSKPAISVYNIKIDTILGRYHIEILGRRYVRDCSQPIGREVIRINGKNVIVKHI